MKITELIQACHLVATRDLAKLYNVSTGNLNKAVKRNAERFPENFMFQLTEEEYYSLRCQNGTLKLTKGKHRKYLPYVFTEYGVTMLAGILKSDIAVEASLKIVDTFIMMKQYISNNLLEQNYINNMVLKHDNEIKLLQDAFDKFKPSNNHIFFEGQIYDAYSLLLDIIETSKESIIIIDNKDLYHCGASFKELGKKCFEISKIEDQEILTKIIEKIM